MAHDTSSLKVYKRYPLTNIAVYNGVTLAHYGLGGAGIIVGYARWPLLGWVAGLVYLVFALAQMYVVMPLVVCPSCAYRRIEGARCVSAMNLVSARIAPVAPPEDFALRAREEAERSGGGLAVDRVETMWVTRVPVDHS